MELKEIVLKLTGPIEPVGSSHIDEKRFENLKVLCELVDDLVVEIDRIIPCKDRVEHSMKIMGEYADEFMGTTLGIQK